MAAEAMRPGADACPDLETIAAYLDHRLTEPERARIAAHLASCETCYFVFTEAAQVRASEGSRLQTAAKVGGPSHAWWATPKIAWSSAVGLAVAACLVLAVRTGMISWRTSDPPELLALVAAVGNERTMEARLTGGFAHGPMRGILRGSDPLAATVSPDVRIAAAQVEKAMRDDRSADALRARGIAALVVGDLNRGVATLEEAAARRPSDARIQSDLSAAYLARAERSANAEDHSRALAAANRAVNADRTLPEALFNRASALEGVAMRKDALEAWQAYLTIDDRSGWADEARVHLRELTGQR